MPIRYDKTVAHFEDVCAVEEAEALLDWLNGRKRPRVDLKGCTHLHTAVLQVLLARHPAVASLPQDPFLARVLAPLSAGEEAS